MNNPPTPQLIKRDGDQCCATTCKCPEGLAYWSEDNFRWKRSIDYLVRPRAGGSPGLANQRLTHLRCNKSRKRRGGRHQKAQETGL